MRSQSHPRLLPRMFALVATLRMSAVVWRCLRMGKVFVAPLSLTPA
jgi:hypothetical protein